MSEKLELSAIIITAALSYFLAELLFPEQLSLGHLLLISSAILLAQGLIRDLSILLSKPIQVATPTQQTARCLCLESTIGITGIIAGALLLGSSNHQIIVFTPWLWSTLLLLILIFGFLIKDWVIDFKTGRISHHKDHCNTIMKWHD